MLEVQNLCAGYGEKQVLRDISVTAAAGEITTVIGPNGCGKTTLLKSVAGLLRHTSGQVLVSGEPVLALSSVERARRMAYLAQGRGVPDITVGRMILHGRFSHLHYPRHYSKADHEIAASVMASMGLTELAHLPMGELSGGMRQKVYIAMALAQQTPVILMDEPTTYLDIAQQRAFGEMMQELAAQGKALLLVLHDLLLALRISHKIVVLSGGTVRFCGTPQELMASPVLGEVYGVEIKSVQTPQGERLFYDF